MTPVFELSTSEYPEGPPDILYSGGFWAWKREISGITYSEYSLTYQLTPFGGGSPVEVEATAEAAQFTVAVDGTLTPTAGRYSWRELLLKTGSTGTQVIASGLIEVRPDPATDTTDPRTPEQVVLDAINDLLAGKFSQDVQSATVRGRSIIHMSIEELLAAKSAYEALVAQDASGETAPSVVLGYFR